MLIKNKIKVVILLISHIYLVLGAKMEYVQDVEAQSQNKSFILKTMAVSVVKNALLAGCWFLPKAYSVENKKYPMIFGALTVLGSCLFKNKLRRDPSNKRKWISLVRDGLYDGSLFLLMLYMSDTKKLLFIPMCDVVFSLLCEYEKDLESTSVLQSPRRALDKNVLEPESFSKNDNEEKQKKEEIEPLKAKIVALEKELANLKENLKEKNRDESLQKKDIERTERLLQDSKAYCQNLLEEIKIYNERQFSLYQKYYQFLNDYPFKKENSHEYFAGYVNFARWLNFLNKQLKCEEEKNIFCYENFFQTMDTYGCCFDFKDSENEAIINYLNENSDNCIVQAIEIIKNFETKFSMFLKKYKYSSFEILQAIYNVCKLSYFGASYDFQQIIEKDGVEKLNQLVEKMGTHVVYVKPKSGKKKGEELGKHLFLLCSWIFNPDEQPFDNEIMNNDCYKVWHPFFQQKSNSFLRQEANKIQRKTETMNKTLQQQESGGLIGQNNSNVFTNKETDDMNNDVESQLSDHVELLPSNNIDDFIKKMVEKNRNENIDIYEDNFENFIKNYFINEDLQEFTINDYIQQYNNKTSYDKVKDEGQVENNYKLYIARMNHKIIMQNQRESPC